MPGRRPSTVRSPTRRSQDPSPSPRQGPFRINGRGPDGGFSLTDAELDTQAPLLSPTPLEAVGFACSVPQFTPNEEAMVQVGGGSALGLGLGLGLSSNWGTYPSKPLRGVSPHLGREWE